MTHRERMLATVRGEPTDCLPCVPRIDLWYNARKKNGTLPDKYRNATLKQIIEDLDIGFHTAIPDFQAYDDPMDAVDRALGIWGAKSIPWRAELRNVQRIVSYTDDTRRVEYATPYGNLTTAVIYNEFMRKSGITITHVAEHAIKSVADFEAVGYIFENIEVCPRYDYLAEFKESDVTGEFCTSGQERDTVTRGAGKWPGENTRRSRSSGFCVRSRWP